MSSKIPQIYAFYRNRPILLRLWLG